MHWQQIANHATRYRQEPSRPIESITVKIQNILNQARDTETIPNCLRSYWFTVYYSRRNSKTEFQFIVSLHFRIWCKQFRVKQFSANWSVFVEREKWETRKKKCRHRIVSFEFDNSQEVAELHTGIHSTIRLKYTNARELSHSVSFDRNGVSAYMCLPLCVYVRERVLVNVMNERVFACKRLDGSWIIDVYVNVNVVGDWRSCWYIKWWLCVCAFWKLWLQLCAPIKSIHQQVYFDILK